LTGHSVSTVQGLGWAGTKNGVLLKTCRDVCDVFITMDANIERHQNLASLPFGIVITRAPSNRMNDLLPIVPELLQVLETVRPGEATHIGRVPRRRDESDRDL
jgi:hypothetical protein